MVIVTHNMQQAARVSDHDGVLQPGRAGQARPADRDRHRPTRSSPTRTRRPPRTTSAAASAEAAIPSRVVTIPSGPPGGARRRRGQRRGGRELCVFRHSTASGASADPRCCVFRQSTASDAYADPRRSAFRHSTASEAFPGSRRTVSRQVDGFRRTDRSHGHLDSPSFDGKRSTAGPGRVRCAPCPRRLPSGPASRSDRHLAVPAARNRTGRRPLVRCLHPGLAGAVDRAAHTAAAADPTAAQHRRRRRPAGSAGWCSPGSCSASAAWRPSSRVRWPGRCRTVRDPASVVGGPGPWPEPGLTVGSLVAMAFAVGPLAVGSAWVGVMVGFAVASSAFTALIADQLTGQRGAPRPRSARPRRSASCWASGWSSSPGSDCSAATCCWPG